MTAPALCVRDLRVELTTTRAPVLEDIALTIAPGEILGVVGESGSGKTTLGLAMLGHARSGVRIAAGQVRIGDAAILELDARSRRDLRGKVVAYIPQDPSAALNPAVRIGRQLTEPLAVHDRPLGQKERASRLAQALDEVRLQSSDQFLKRFPHQLSGGQQQRVALAMAFILRPRLIVFDEPTTGLDVATQAHLLDTIRTLCKLHGTAGMYISHDLAVVSHISTRLAVLYAGRIVESGPAALLAGGARHPYTHALLRAVPRDDPDRELRAIDGRLAGVVDRPATGCAFAPRCAHASSACVEAIPPLVAVGSEHWLRCVGRPAHDGFDEPAPHQPRPVVKQQRPTVVLSVRSLSASYGRTAALSSISFDVGAGECVAIVGESGSGKTTLSRAIAGVHENWTGSIALDGVPIERAARDRATGQRRRIQYVSQNPFAALNPRRTVEANLRRPIEIFESRQRARSARARLAAALQAVALDGSLLHRFPGQLSGGESQRVAIARALVAEPAVLLCDEVTSALDVSVQAAIVQLLRRLQQDLGLTMLFVTHNLALVRYVADRTIVMKDGHLLEEGDTTAVLSTPQHPYTAELLANAPTFPPASGHVAIGR